MVTMLDPAFLAVGLRLIPKLKRFVDFDLLYGMLFSPVCSSIVNRSLKATDLSIITHRVTVY